MSVALAAIVVVALGAPHVLRLDRVEPALAAGIWLVTLTLRAITAAFCALFIILYLPATELFTLISQWCWHTVLPYMADSLGFAGHDLGDAALIAPAFVLAASVLWVIVGLWRAARKVHRLVLHAIGPGPGESLVVGDGEVLVGAAGLRRPRVIVSAGALTAFDDEELAASLDHERGHIARRHRFVLVYTELCRALARFLPGTRAAARELSFHLERDADCWALRREHDPAALASAICKAVESRLLVGTAFSLSGVSVSRRVVQLLESPEPRAANLTTKAVAALLVSVTLAATAALPVAAHAGWHGTSATHPTHHCVH